MKLREFAVVVAITACVHSQMIVGAPAKKNNSPAEPQGQFQTRVYVRRQCLLSEDKKTGTDQAELFGLAAIFLPLLIEKALGGVSAALKKAGSEEALRDSGKLPTYLYQLSNEGGNRQLGFNSNLGCVLIIRGKFSQPDPADQSKIAFPKDGVFTRAEEENDRKERLIASNIPVTEIAILYEAAINLSNDQTAMHYESRFLEVNGFQGSRSSDTRALVVSIALNAPGSKEDDSTFSLALLNLGEQKKGTILGPDQLKSTRSGWLGGLGISEVALKAIENTAVPANRTVRVVPITVEGTFVETEKGSKALLFIAEVLNSTKAEVAKNVSDSILEDKKKKAAAEEDALEKLRQEEEKAYEAYLSAEAALVEPDDSTPEELRVKRFQVEQTKRIWCMKFKALANLGIPPSGRPDCP